MTVTAPVRVEGGLVQPVPNPHDPSLHVAFGIPYAAPPLGPLRFRDPQPVEPWSGVRICDTRGAVCPQKLVDPRWGPSPLQGHPQSEDCLFLDVYLPEKTNVASPVFVWLHGGAFKEGGSADPNFDGTGLARKGVIVVVPNYRLHIFGFLAHPELSRESASGTSGMWGILDAIQALRWVKRNIAAFGGDADQVTVGGQSAGSAMAQTMLVSPLTEDLVHGVIIHSGPRCAREPTLSAAALSYKSLEKAEQEGIELFEELGISSLDEARRYNDQDKILEVANRRDKTVWGPPPFWRLVRDGYIIPKRWGEIFEQGLAKDIPVLAGQNYDEGGTFNEPRFNLDGLHECVLARLGPDQTHSKGSQELVDKFFELYPVDERPEGPLLAWNLSARDHTRVSTSLWAEDFHQHARSPFYGYYFCQAPPPWDGWVPDYTLPKVPGFTMNKGPVKGAFHSAEYPYTFNSLSTNQFRPWTKEDRIVGDKISTLWANFIKTGNPNGNGSTDLPEGVPEWTPLGTPGGAQQRLGPGDDFGPIANASTPEREAFWRAYLEAQPYH